VKKVAEMVVTTAVAKIAWWALCLVDWRVVQWVDCWVAVKAVNWAD